MTKFQAGGKRRNKTYRSNVTINRTCRLELVVLNVSVGWRNCLRNLTVLPSESNNKHANNKTLEKKKYVAWLARLPNMGRAERQRTQLDYQEKTDAPKQLDHKV